jgi:parvulin-like peptidyl-prolyl isomerase
MRKKEFLILAVLLLLAGCGEKPKYTPQQLVSMPFAKRDGLPDATGGFCLAVGDQTVPADDVIGPVFDRLSQVAQKTDFDRFTAMAKPAIEQVLKERISAALLYQQAKKEFGKDSDDQINQAAQAEVKKFVASYGGDYARAEQAIKQGGMDWGSFEEYQKKMILSQSYLAQKMPKEQSITYGELRSAYDDVKDRLYTRPAALQFRLIDIEPAKLDANDPNTSPGESAKQLAQQLIARANNGEDFGDLARQYSHGYTALAGGLWNKIDPSSLAKPYDILAAEAEKLKPGQVAGPIEAPGHVFIMQLVEYQPKTAEPFEKVQEELRAKISFERRRQAIDKLNAELLAQASVGDRTEFVDFCVREIYRMANK